MTMSGVSAGTDPKTGRDDSPEFDLSRKELPMSSFDSGFKISASNTVCRGASGSVAIPISSALSAVRDLEVGDIAAALAEG